MNLFKSLSAKAIVLGLLVSVGAHAADKFKLISANDLAQEIKKDGQAVHIYDANNADTRTKYGVIPGAQTLESSAKYDLKKLPADKAAAVVFYCANTQCMASHTAAERAADSGYTNVSVMKDGIMGWKSSGQATSKAN